VQLGGLRRTRRLTVAAAGPFASAALLAEGCQDPVGGLFGVDPCQTLGGTRIAGVDRLEDRPMRLERSPHGVLGARRHREDPPAGVPVLEDLLHQTRAARGGELASMEFTVPPAERGEVSARQGGRHLLERLVERQEVGLGHVLDGEAGSETFERGPHQVQLLDILLVHLRDAGTDPGRE